MQKIFLKQTLTLLMCSAFVLRAFSQDTTMSTMSGTSAMSIKPINNFSTFSIGINVGGLTPSVPIGGSNNFTHPQWDLGYGLYIKNQFTHLLAVQAEFLRGNVEGNNSDALGNGTQTSNPYKSFKTNLNWSGSVSGVVTFGNINWLSDKNTVIPYVSAGAGIAGYKPILTTTSGTEVKYKEGDKSIHEFFVPVGGGLKFQVAQDVNIDLGFRMNFVDADNFDGYNSGGYHKDKFSYAFAGIEFALGGKPQLMTNNPVSQFKKDLMDENEALKASVTATANQNASEIDALKNQIADMKKDADNDGVPDYLDKCPGTPDSVKVDGSGCPLPKMQPPPPPPAQTVVVTEEDRRVVNEAIKNLQFDFGKSTIKPSSYASLDKVAQILINKNFSLKLAGHTDNIGSDDANMKLSKDRAEAVKDYLVSKGANPSRIEATGYGETQPIASNKTAAGRAKNRRVEFTLY